MLVGVKLFLPMVAAASPSEGFLHILSYLEAEDVQSQRVHEDMTIFRSWQQKEIDIRGKLRLDIDENNSCHQIYKIPNQMGVFPD